MVDSKEIPPKLYKKLLVSSYVQNQQDAKEIKDKWSRNGNPILQKENRYFSPRTRGNPLTQEYFKKMAEKPEKPHIKRIPIQRNLSCSLTVLQDQPQRPIVRINPRKNQSSISAPKIERKNQKQISSSNYYKYFYLDNFNSIKQNENDIRQKHQVSKNNIYL